MGNPSRGQSTAYCETGRIRRLIHVAREADRYSRNGWGVDWGTGNGIVRNAVSAALRRPFHGFDVGQSPIVGHYGMATCFDVLEHAHAGEDVLAGIHRSLVHGAPLAITLPNRWWLFETHAESPWNRVPGFNWGPWAGLLRRRYGRNVPCYTLWELGWMLEQAGFKVVRLGYLTAPLDKGPGGGLIRNHHETRVPMFATNVFAVAVKE